MENFHLRTALAAIDAGTYGICVDCGGEIPEGRLRVLPDGTSKLVYSAAIAPALVRAMAAAEMTR